MSLQYGFHRTLTLYLQRLALDVEVWLDEEVWIDIQEFYLPLAHGLLAQADDAVGRGTLLAEVYVH